MAMPALYGNGMNTGYLLRESEENRLRVIATTLKEGQSVCKALRSTLGILIIKESVC